MKIWNAIRGQNPGPGEDQPWQRSILSFLYTKKIKKPLEGIGAGVKSGLTKIIIIAILILIIFLVGNAYIKKHI